MAAEKNEIIAGIPSSHQHDKSQIRDFPIKVILFPQYRS
jgi:hypothetical protein